VRASVWEARPGLSARVREAFAAKHVRGDWYELGEDDRRRLLALVAGDC